MFRIETEFGNFHSYKDLLIYMKEENIQKVRMTTYLLDTPIGLKNLTYSLKDIDLLAKRSTNERRWVI